MKEGKIEDFNTVGLLWWTLSPLHCWLFYIKYSNQHHRGFLYVSSLEMQQAIRSPYGSTGFLWTETALWPRGRSVSKSDTERIPSECLSVHRRSSLRWDWRREVKSRRRMKKKAKLLVNWTSNWTSAAVLSLLRSTMFWIGSNCPHFYYRPGPTILELLLDWVLLSLGPFPFWVKSKVFGTDPSVLRSIVGLVRLSSGPFRVGSDGPKVPFRWSPEA